MSQPPYYSRTAGNFTKPGEGDALHWKRRAALETTKPMTTEYLRQTINDVTASLKRARNDLALAEESLGHRIADHETTLEILQGLLQAAETREKTP